MHNQVKTQSEVIAREKALADEALMEALPAVEAAAAALENLDKKDLDEIKAFTNPPQLVKDVCMQVCSTATATIATITTTVYLSGFTLAARIMQCVYARQCVACNTCFSCVPVSECTKNVGSHLTGTFHAYLSDYSTHCYVHTIYM